MDLLIAFLVFIVVMVSAIIFDYTMIIALVIGLAAFMLVGKHRGFSFKSMAKMGMEERRNKLR